MGAKGEAQAVLCCLVCCGSIWLGFFFGLNFPEVVINNNFQSTTCTVNSLVIIPRYCCRVSGSCNICNSQAAYTASTNCTALFATEPSKNPAQCSASPSTATCAQQNVGCCNGYYCCQTCCSTCERCYRCGKNSRCCSSYSCNCYCCSSIANQYAVFTCPTCYSVVWTLIYNDNGGTQRQASRSAEYDVNKAAADATAAYWAVGNKFSCWYNPDDYNDLVFGIGYTAWKWVLTSFPTAFIMLICAAMTMPCVETCWRRCDSTSRVREHATQWTLGPLWMGLIIPIGLLLPISFAAVPHADQRGLKVSVCILVVVAWAIGVRVWRVTKGAPSFIWLFYAVLVIIPWAIILPVCIYNECGDGAHLALSIIPIATACPFFLFFKVSVHTDRVQPLVIGTSAATVATPATGDSAAAQNLTSLKAELERIRLMNDQLERQLRDEQIAIANDAMTRVPPTSLFTPPPPNNNGTVTTNGPSSTAIAYGVAPPPSYADATMITDVS